MEKLDNSAASGRALLDKPNVYEREQFRHDPQFRGPLSKRSCTDVICLLIFFVFLIAFGFAGYFAFREGDIDKILVPRDSKGFQCGRDSEVLDKKYLLFFDLVKCADPLVPIQGCQTTQICVEKCPNSTFVFDRSMCRSSDVSEIRKSLICLKEIDVNSITTCDAIQKHIDEEKCAKWYMKSEPLGNLCLPTSIDDAVKTIEKSDVVQALQNLQIIGSINGMGQLIVEDTIHVWPMLAVGLALSAVCSLLIIAIMRWVAGPIVWASIIGILGLLGTGKWTLFLICCILIILWLVLQHRHAIIVQFDRKNFHETSLNLPVVLRHWQFIVEINATLKMFVLWKSLGDIIGNELLCQILVILFFDNNCGW